MPRMIRFEIKNRRTGRWKKVEILDDLPTPEPWQRVCPACKGTGEWKGSQYCTYIGPECSSCNGKGVLRKRPRAILPAKPTSIWRIYSTTSGRNQALTEFRLRGFKYFVTWKDVSGYGLEAEWRADWQNDHSPAYID